MGDTVRLIQAAEMLRDSHADEVAISTSRLLNPLLDLWALASDVSPEAAAPIEALLTVYAGPRELASPAELAELVDRLRRSVDPALV